MPAPPAPPLRVAAGQAVAVPGDVPANLGTASRLVAMAGVQGVRLLVLPEAFPTGYDERVFAGELPDSDAVPALLAPLAEAVDAAGVVVLLSLPVRDPHPGESRAVLAGVLVAPGADPVVAYRKQHLDADERRFFVPGDAGGTAVVDGVPLGLAICYDTSFPEHARDAADAGVVGYLASAAFFPGSADRRDAVLAARAADNGIYVVAACATGPSGGRAAIGGSGVWDPDGTPVARLGADDEGLAVADVDPALVDEVQRHRTLRADRRGDLGRRVVHTVGGRRSRG